MYEIHDLISYALEFLVAGCAGFIGRLALLAHMDRTISRKDLGREIPTAIALGIIGRGIGDAGDIHGFPLLAISVVCGLIGPAPFIRIANAWISAVGKQKDTGQ